MFFAIIFGAIPVKLFALIVILPFGDINDVVDPICCIPRVNEQINPFFFKAFCKSFMTIVQPNIILFPKISIDFITDNAWSELNSILLLLIVKSILSFVTNFVGIIVCVN